MSLDKLLLKYAGGGGFCKLVPLLPNPQNNIPQNPDQYLHPISHKLKLFFIGLGHPNHGKLLIQWYTMLTINANSHPLMRAFHKPTDEKRMVVILQDEQYGDWLSFSNES